MKISKRELLIGVSALAINNALAQTITPQIGGGLGFDGGISIVGSKPVFLPTATIADFALKGSASAYVDIGNMSLPAGDWCIGVTAGVPATASTDFFLLSLGTQSDTILTDTGALTIGWPGAGAAQRSGYGWAAVGKDDTGTWLSPRTFSAFASSSQQGVSGQQQAAGTPDAVSRTLFIQKQSGVVSIWWIDTNCAAIQYSAQTTTFGAISAKAARLGCLGKLALSGFSAITYQRFFKTSQALTQYQMEAFAGGVDPRVIIPFSAAAGDLLFTFPSVPADLATFTDLIQGQTATAHGTFTSATALLPASVDQNQIRVDIDRYRGYQSNGATSDIYFTGNVYGSDGVIHAQITDQSGVQQFPYLPIANSRNGKFVGTYPGMTTDNGNHLVKVKKLVGAVQVGNQYQTNTIRFVTGPVLEWLGQSLAAQMRTNNNFSVANARNQATPYDATMRDNYPAGASQQAAPGYGEGRLTQIVTTALGFQFMQMNDAVSGSSIDQWINNAVGFNSTSPTGILTNALYNINRFRPKDIIWHQGENSLGSTYAQYYSKLTSLYNAIGSVITWPWRFWIIPVDNNFTNSFNYDQQMQGVRSAQIDWANNMIAAGKNVVLACTVNDILKANTNADGIHKLAVAGGYGIYSERVAQTLLFLEGNVANSGLGPKIVSAVWDGTTGITVTLAQNGGTGLQTPNVANITGFTASLTTVAGTQVPLLLGSPLTISTATVTDATHAQLTLSAPALSNPYIWYQYGCPGLGTTDAACGLSNPLYDNRTPAINTTLGFPVQPMTAPMLTTGP